MKPSIAAALLVAALAACAPGAGSEKRPDTPDPGPLDPELLRHYSKTLQQYTDSLLLCNSTLPQDWEKARRQLEVLHPFRVFDDDTNLIQQFRAGSTPARFELGRRGVMLHAMSVFSEPYDKRKWDDARGILVAAGEPGRVLLLRVLLGMLLNGQYRDVWSQVRFQIVEAGPDGLETTLALARRLATDTPAATPLFKIDDLSQVVMVLIAFGDSGRAHVEALSRHEKPNVRRSVAKGIGDALYAEGAAILARLVADDPEWMVRTGAAQAAGKLGPARRTLGPTLVARVSKEGDRLVLREVLRAIGEIHFVEAVPVLMGALEHPVFEISEAAMIALYHISGEKFTRKEEWVRWYRTVYPRWVERQPR